MNPYDAIIIGAGTAGLPCAIAASEAGARVALVEKSGRVGGTLHVNGGQMSAAGTRRQRERGIVDSPDAHFGEVLRIGHGLADKSLVRLAVEEAPKTLDWLDDLGFPFSPEVPAVWHGHEPYEVPRTYWGPDAGRSVLATLHKPWTQALATGNVTLLLEHALEEILPGRGAPPTVVVRGPGGRLPLQAETVVLATGGYAANPDLFAELTPGAPRLVSGAPLTSSGDGLVAARAIGADIRGGACQLPSLGAVELGELSGRADVWSSWLNLVPQHRRPREIHVNVRGERFLREDEPSVHLRERAVAGQPDQTFWVVFDERARTAGESLLTWESPEGLKARAAAGDGVWAADDIGSLATAAGVAPDGLLETARQWNRAVSSGRDEFRRENPDHPLATPPFYAVRSVAATFLSFGGLRIDPEFRVLDSAGMPIPGLHAIGELIGAATTMGDAFVGGMCVTPALSFGRLLGRRLSASPRSRSARPDTNNTPTHLTP